MSELIPVEFTVISEPWEKYKLEDQTKLFARLIVTKVVRGFNENGQPAYNLNPQPIFVTHAPESLRGQPAAVPINFGDPSAYKVVASLDFNRMGPEKWNEYHFTDGTVLKARLEISAISRTDKFAQDGDPGYMIQSQPLIRFKISDQVLKSARTPVRQPDVKAPYG